MLGGTRGIGRAICESLISSGHDVVAAGRNDIDTSDMHSVYRFAAVHNTADILVLNTGGPPAKPFCDITDAEWQKYHNQLFAGFVILLREIRIRDGGYIFLISSSVVREPSANLVISSAYRAAFVEVFKVYSVHVASRHISCINIAPGLIDTDRTRQILDDINMDVSTLPMGRMGEPREIGDFVAGIVDKNIKYLSGVTITFDGAASTHVF